MHLAPFHHRKYARYRGNIEMWTWKDIMTRMCGDQRTSKSEFEEKWNANLDFKKFATTYAAGWKHGLPGSRCDGEYEHGFV